MPHTSVSQAKDHTNETRRLATLLVISQALSGVLNLKAGMQGRFATEFVGYRFNAEAATYVRNTGEPVAASGSLDLLLVADLDGARVHLIWENPHGLTYYAAPYFVGLDRGVGSASTGRFLTDASTHAHGHHIRQCPGQTGGRRVSPRVHCSA